MTGASAGLDKQTVVLNRKIMWYSTGIVYDPDLWHCDIEAPGLQRANVVSTPSTKEKRACRRGWDGTPSGQSDTHRGSIHRVRVARLVKAKWDPSEKLVQSPSGHQPRYCTPRCVEDRCCL